jgi:hypothetical protein
MPFSDYMVDTITLQDETGRNSAGDPTFGAQYTALARVESASKLITDVDGNEVMSDHAIATETAITNSTRIWLPGSDTAKIEEAKRPITVKRAREMDGSEGHYEVFL